MSEKKTKEGPKGVARCLWDPAKGKRDPELMNSNKEDASPTK